MPRFLDYHETMPPLPPEALEGMQEKIKAGKADEFGVVALNAIMGGGHAWCVTEAPSAEAVCKSHEAMGIPQDGGNVTEVQVIG